MLLTTLGGPPPSTGKNKTTVVILSVCGGCAVLSLIAVIVFGFLAARVMKSAGSAISGMMTITTTMPAFLNDLQNHDYTACESMIDPSAKERLSAAKIKSMEEAMEKKLGKLQSFSASGTNSGKTTRRRGAGGKTVESEIEYSYPLTYEKGTATATFKFVMSTEGGSAEPSIKMSGKIADFTLVADGQ